MIRRPRSRQLVMLLALVLASALVAAACGGDDGASGSEGDQPAAGAPCPTDLADGTTEITLWHPYNTLTKTTLESIVEAYNASQTKVHVDVESQGNTIELQKKFSDSIGNPDTLPDLVFTEDTNLQFMSDSGVVVPATSCRGSDAEGAEYLDGLLPAVTSAYTVGDTLWPAAFSVSTLMMYANNAELKAAGLEPDVFPQTLDELRTMAEKIKAANLPGVTAPLVMKLDPWVLETLLTGSKQLIVDEDNGRSALAGASELDNDRSTAVLDWIQGMVADGLLQTIPYGDSIDDFLAFSQGNASFIISGQRSITTVAAVMDGQDGGIDIDGAPSTETLQKLDIDAGLFPGLEEAGQSGVSGSAGYVVDTSDAEVAAAWDFMKYFNALPQQQRWVLEGSYLPSSQSVIDSPEVQAAFDSTRAGRWTATVAEGMTDLDPDFPGPLVGPYNEYRDELIGLLTKVADGAPVGATLTESSDAITELLRSYRSEVGG
ncbi:extracellular solute-binding protein [Dermatobacter hominis]|uniref:extracellular solute-binding protein n=1 Tax=Dermatobacter hominis TaxID=2884263 RepID=UPI001D116BB3|nr:extracellular solute-binding protein [Dermatobacter hominis]UDY38095.1 extracellular solute-binding protein [Dermatobacter hominis]